MSVSYAIYIFLRRCRLPLVGVRTAEERDAEAFANAIVIEETQPEPAADEDDSQVMDLTLSQPDA